MRQSNFKKELMSLVLNMLSFKCHGDLHADLELQVSENMKLVSYEEFEFVIH